MGRSHWVFEKGDNDFSDVYALVTAHNAADNVGETLHIDHTLLAEGRYFMIVLNFGGGELTSDYIEANYTGKVWYPWVKPAWWGHPELTTVVDEA